MTIGDFTMGHFGLGGKNAIVTGGNTGLGQVLDFGRPQGDLLRGDATHTNPAGRWIQA